MFCVSVDGFALNKYTEARGLGVKTTRVQLVSQEKWAVGQGQITGETHGFFF